MTRALIEKIAKRDHVPIATKAAELIQLALELEEDLTLGLIAEERMSQKNIKWVPHHLAWK